MLVALDGTVLSVAQPALGRDLAAGVAQVQWTSTAYLLAVAAFLVVAGRLGDRVGHGRLLLVGVLGFAGTSAGIALAPGVGWVIGLRAAQGVFGALLQPATLALLRLAYPPDRLAGPVAVRTGAIGVAAAAGPLLGGFLVAEAGWRTVFVLNVPIALLIAVVTLAVKAPAPRRDTAAADTAAAPVPWSGAALLAAALACLVHALSGVPVHGWAAGPTLLGLGGTVALAVGFVRAERRSAEPLVPVAVARSVPVAASMALLLCVSGGMFGALFTATFLLQERRGLDPLDTGLLVLPLTACLVLGSPAAGLLLRRCGPRRTALAGTALVVAGVAGLGGWAGPAVTVAFGVLGAGFAAVMVTATGTVVGDAPPGYAGVVGGLKQTAMNVGPALGIAVAAGAGTAPGALLFLAALAGLGLVPAALLPRGPGRPGRGAGAGPALPAAGSPGRAGPGDDDRQVRYAK
ncbi:MFS transporter [Streptomyces sp. WAC06614]|uniref:MFS transporter n=1 Tax=Streptomyces sp. WAC06614 TaxID=2487416 RepID=UPI000F769FFB|nr:MFS transporter [Streptomyces sp. WAC06614]RSS75590.1 MFS transporter [Streptomyces sp. WAC06614]